MSQLFNNKKILDILSIWSTLDINANTITYIRLNKKIKPNSIKPNLYAYNIGNAKGDSIARTIKIYQFIAIKFVWHNLFK